LIFHVIKLGATTVKHVPRLMILSGSIFAMLSSLLNRAASSEEIVAMKPPRCPPKLSSNACC
jgi:hypothetical protein